MSIVPSDSASQNGESHVGVGQPTLSISPPVYPGTDVLNAIGPARYNERLASYDQLMAAYYKQVSSYLAAYQSYCRLSTGSQGSSVAPLVAESLSAVSSGSSSSGSSASSCGSGLTGSVGSLPGARMGKTAVRKLARVMRSRGVTTRLPGGYCYARLVRPEARESVAVALGAYPALGDLLARPREEFLPRTATESVVLSVGADGVAHVGYASGAVGTARVSYNDVVSALAARSEFEFGSYGHAVVSSSGPVRCDYGSLEVSLETPVGAPPRSVAPVVGPGSSMPEGPSVYLAGSLDSLQAPGWRGVVAARFESPWTVLVPACSGLPTSSRGVSDSSGRLWERRALSGATAVVFNFVSGADSTAAFADLAGLPGGSRAFVACPVSHEHRGTAEYLCASKGFVLMESVSQLLDRFADLSLGGSCVDVPSAVELSSACVGCFDGLSSLRFPGRGEPVFVGSVVTVAGVDADVPRLVVRVGGGYACRDEAWLRAAATSAFEAADFGSALVCFELAAHLRVFHGSWLPTVVPVVTPAFSGLLDSVDSFRVV